MAVRALDGAVLVGDAGIVAARLHAVMGAQRIVAPGQVLAGVAIQIAEGGREAVAAMLTRGAAERPEGVLQALGQGDIALAAEHDMGMLEAGIGEPEVIEPMIERLAGDGDGEFGHVGEVGQAHAPGLVHLAEDDLLLGTMQGAPGSDPALEGAADAGAEFGMAADDLLEESDGPQARGGLEERDDLAVPDSSRADRDAGARVGPSCGRAAGVLLEAIGGGGAEPGLGGGDRGGVGVTELHVQPHLAVGDMAAGQRVDSSLA